MTSAASKEPHGRLGEHEAVVIPIDRMARREAGEQIVDFSSLGLSEVAGYFMCQLRHPSHSNLHGLDMAATLEKHLGYGNARQPETTLEGRLYALSKRIVTNGADIERKEAGDDVYKSMIDVILSTKADRSVSSEQRSALLKLIDLREKLPGMSEPEDNTWLDVASRLMR